MSNSVATKSSGPLVPAPSADLATNADWVRFGVGLAAAGYALNTAFNLAFVSGLNATRWREIAATAICGVAFVGFRRNPRLAAVATVSAVWMALSTALLSSGRLLDEVLLVYPLLGLVAGLFWGATGAVTLALANSLVIPLAVYLGGSWGDDFSRFTAADAQVLIVEEIVIVATAVLTTAGLRTLRRLNNELEARVLQRTSDLAARIAEVEQLSREQQALLREVRSGQEAADRASSRLQEANTNLLAANLELEAYSYSVSHDLRSPLRNVAGFLELLRARTQGSLDRESQRLIAVVTAETTRMGELIDDLLTFSRIGRTEMQQQPVAIEALVSAVRDELKPELDGRQLEWRLGPLPVVRGDPVLLRQVIANLLGNAVKFTRHRAAAWIEIGQLPPQPGDKSVTVFVRDNGAGFNPKYVEKLFGVFQRLHNSREFEGTGIGLANVKRIIVRHGGRVWAEGQLDGGATFFFTLPLADA